MTILFRSAVSGLLYEKPEAAGGIDSVIVDDAPKPTIHRTNIEGVPDATYTLEGSDWQLLVLSLALCAQLRPGWADHNRSVAEKLGAGLMFDEFRRYNPNVKPQ